jgi:hypothetical protein
MGIVVRLDIAVVLRARTAAIRVKINDVCLGAVFEARFVVHINAPSNRKFFSSRELRAIPGK